MTHKPYLVADLFCGAGGSSTGAERAIRAMGRRMTLVCVNHWPVAIETHKLNHPSARHYVEDIAVADPNKLVPEGRLDLLMASPECRFYSRARGGRPVHDQGRMNPWAVHRWLTALEVRSLLVENVPEFVDWGPLNDDGTPDSKHKGEYFQSWFFAIRRLGYRAEWKYLNAANYGDATTRVRFFLIARKDGRRICWPEPSHSESGEADMLGQLPRWRAAREIIEWSNPGRSLLDDPHYQKKPLSEKTRRRIARGLERFGGPLAPLYINLLGIESNGNGHGEEVEPFVMGRQGNSPAYRSIDQPIPTQVTSGGSLLIKPEVKPFVMGKESNPAYRNVEEPIQTVTTHSGHQLVNPTLVKYYGTAMAASVDDPVPTVTTKPRFGLVNPEMTPFVIGQHSGSAPRPVDKPIPTVMGDGAISFITPHIEPFIVQNRIRPDGDRVYQIDRPLTTVTGHGAGALVNPVLVDVNHDGEGDRSRDVEKPLGAVTTRRGVGLAEPVIIQTDQTGGNGICARPVTAPVPTIVTKANLAVAEPALSIPAGNIDPRRLVVIDGQPYLLDIRFRMLSNLELARAMGFTDAESQYEFVGNTSEVTKQIGNAVPVNLSRALVTVILGEKS